MTAPTLEVKYADRIAKLLNQAENTAATPQEAEAFMAKAAQLMLEYAIDEQMIAAARGLTVDELVQDTFHYRGIYRVGHRDVAIKAAKHFGLKVVLGHDTYQKPIQLPLFLAGFRSDVERARLLDTSLQLQCVNAHSQWWKKNKDALSWMDRGLTYRTRRDFVIGFAEGVGSKLYEARRQARAEAKVHEAERTNVSPEAASASVELVLVGRVKRVEEYYDSVWGGATRSVSRRYNSGAGNGRSAGFNAGLSANTNTGAGLGGAKGALGR